MASPDHFLFGLYDLLLSLLPIKVVAYAPAELHQILVKNERLHTFHDQKLSRKPCQKLTELIYKLTRLKLKAYSKDHSSSRQ